MDPAHLVHPPRAHPSGSHSGHSGDGGHYGHHPNSMMPDDAATTTTQRKSNTVVHEPWFMALVVTMLLAILALAAAAMLFFKRRHQLTKELGHLSGELQGNIGSTSKKCLLNFCQTFLKFIKNIAGAKLWPTTIFKLIIYGLGIWRILLMMCGLRPDTQINFFPQ